MSGTLETISHLVASDAYRVSNHAGRQSGAIGSGLVQRSGFASNARALGPSSSQSRDSGSDHRLHSGCECLVIRPYDAKGQMMFERIEKTIKHIHEGKYAADVEVELLYDDSIWSPTIGALDIQKLDRVRIALRRGDVEGAAREAKVFKLIPIAAE